MRTVSGRLLLLMLILMARRLARLRDAKPRGTCGHALGVADRERDHYQHCGFANGFRHSIREVSTFLQRRKRHVAPAGIMQAAYYFSREPPSRGSQALGAYHTAEIAYVLDNLGISNRPWEETDRKLAGAMSSYWLNFAVTGDPNGSGLPQWPVYETQSEWAMGLGNRIEPTKIPHRHALDFFYEYFARQRAK
jgi:hypothetical protein